MVCMIHTNGPTIHQEARDHPQPGRAADRRLPPRRRVQAAHLAEVMNGMTKLIKNVSNSATPPLNPEPVCRFISA